MINSARRNNIFVGKSHKHAEIMSLIFIFEIIISFLEYKCSKQFVYNNGLCYNLVNTFSLYTIMDYPKGSARQSYRAYDLINF